MLKIVYIFICFYKLNFARNRNLLTFNYLIQYEYGNIFNLFNTTLHCMVGLWEEITLLSLFLQAKID